MGAVAEDSMGAVAEYGMMGVVADDVTDVVAEYGMWERTDDCEVEAK